MPRVFFRLVRFNPPRFVDMLSKEALGEPLRDDTPENRRLWQGVSVYATEAQARRKGRVSPMLGRYIARIELPDDSTVVSERTTTSSGHHTLWGDASSILTAITHVFSVASERDR
jgi:hypothetical protein